MPHIHWVARQNKLEIPNDEEEVNTRVMIVYTHPLAKGCIYTSITAVVWVILLPLQLRTHHIGEAPGPACASPHLS
jgi:hypothetical protein